MLGLHVFQGLLAWCSVHYRHLLTSEKAADGQLLLYYWLVVLLGQDRTAEQKLALTFLLRTNVAITASGTLASTANLPGPIQWCRGSPLGLGASTVLIDTDFPVSDGFQGVAQCERVGIVQ